MESLDRTYTLYRFLPEDDVVFALHYKDVEAMNAVLNRYANAAVPDSELVNAYRVKDFSIMNNKLKDYTLDSPAPEKIQMNLLEPYIFSF
ncbi:MAG: hypothetical protein PF489_11615 [Salinivirgaceae bacterium]|jgi:hypothetical protein|nr:hypothetical protein [Salinivirgaceae bacterium]